MQNLYEELNATDPKVRKTVADGESLISKSKDASANHIKQNVELLQQRWKNIQMRAADKKVTKIYVFSIANGLLYITILYLGFPFYLNMHFVSLNYVTIKNNKI